MTRGDVLATMLPNRSELATLMFAARQLGVALTPINPALTADEASYQLADAGARLAIVDREAAEKLEGSGAQLLDVDQLGDLAGEPPSTEPELADTALLIYTSGTTGGPKGVVLDHANVAAMLRMNLSAINLGPADRALVVLPLFHVNGLIVSVCGPLAADGSTVIRSRFTPRRSGRRARAGLAGRRGRRAQRTDAEGTVAVNPYQHPTVDR